MARTIWTILWRIIEESFLPSLVQIQPVVKEEIAFEAIVEDERRMTTTPDDGQWTSNDYNSSPWAKGPGELKV